MRLFNKLNNAEQFQTEDIVMIRDKPSQVYSPLIFVVLLYFIIECLDGFWCSRSGPGWPCLPHLSIEIKRWKVRETVTSRILFDNFILI